MLSMKTKKTAAALLLLLPLLSVTAHAIDIDKIVREVKSYLGEQLTNAYCMVKRDCHQRVVYVVGGILAFVWWATYKLVSVSCSI